MKKYRQRTITRTIRMTEVEATVYIRDTKEVETHQHTVPGCETVEEIFSYLYHEFYCCGPYVLVDVDVIVSTTAKYTVSEAAFVQMAKSTLPASLIANVGEVVEV